MQPLQPTLTYKPDLEGKPVTLQYKPTPRSRVWRTALYRPCYTQQAQIDAETLQSQEGWNAIQWTIGTV